MAYDVVQESRTMLSSGVPEMTFNLTRRRRFIPLAFDIEGDAAATLFVRRGVNGNPWLEAWTLEQRDGEWFLLGGGSGDGYEEIFEPRDSIADLAVRYGSGWTARGAGRMIPWPRKGVNHVEMRLASEVASLRVGNRSIEVPAHGLAIVMWQTRRPPLPLAIDADGKQLGAVPLQRGWHE